MPDPQLRPELLARVADGIRSRMPDAPDPDVLAEVSLLALSDGCEWLLRVAEHYQARAHAAEALLVPEVRRSRRWRPRT